MVEWTADRSKRELCSYIANCQRARLALLEVLSVTPSKNPVEMVRREFYPRIKRAQLLQETLSRMQNEGIVTYSSGRYELNDTIKSAYSYNLREPSQFILSNFDWGHGELVVQLSDNEMYLVNKLLFEYGGSKNREFFESELIREAKGRAGRYGQEYHPDYVADRIKSDISTLVSNGFLRVKGLTIVVSDELQNDILLNSESFERFYSDFSKSYANLMLLRSFDIKDLENILENYQLPEEVLDELKKAINSFLSRNYKDSLLRCGRETLDKLAAFLDSRLFPEEPRNKLIEVIQKWDSKVDEGFNKKEDFPCAIDLNVDQRKNLLDVLKSLMYIPRFYRNKMAGHVIKGFEVSSFAPRFSLLCIYAALDLARNLNVIEKK